MSSEFNALFREFLDDPDRVKYRQTGDPHDWQQRFEDRIERIGEQGRALREQIAQVEAEAKNRFVRIRVGAGGELLDLAFLPDAGRIGKAKLTEAFLGQYGAACAEAHARVQEILAASDLPRTDFSPFDTDQEQA